MCPDEQLAAGVQRGNQSDMQALVERYYEPLLRFCFWLSGGSQAQAEDMVQESFLRMMRGISGYDPARPFKPWLYTIARRVAYNLVARAEMRRTVGLEEDADLPDGGQQPEEWVLTNEARGSALAALRRLPARQREAILLFYYENLSQKEIAEILNVPVGTVKSRLSLGLKQLRVWVEIKV